MATVELTRHLYTFFPALAGKPLSFENVTTVAEVVRALDELAPGIGFYICDERGRLRRHVNIFVDEELIADRGRLSDRVDANSRIMIMQALSGG
jgi:molybdopterin synthase sulfur carrier subunit